MSKETNIALFLLLCILISCKKEDSTVVPPLLLSYAFADGFESNSQRIEDIFPSDGSRWTNIQQNDPSNATNEIGLSAEEVSAGALALHLVSRASDQDLSKIDIENGGLNMQAGDQVIIEADYFIKGDSNLENLLLLDVECCSCWDPTVGNNQCPGIRLMISGEGNFLSIERGKIAAPTLTQSALSFPRDQWVNVRWEMTLSDQETGSNRLFINDQEVINSAAMNMPNAQILRTLFEQEGIDFTLQEPTSYERVQVGATANPTGEDVEMFIDNFSIEITR